MAKKSKTNPTHKYLYLSILALVAISGYAGFKYFVKPQSLDINEVRIRSGSNPYIRNGTFSPAPGIQKLINQAAKLAGCKSQYRFDPTFNNCRSTPKAKAGIICSVGLIRVAGAPVFPEGMSCDNFLKTYYPLSAKYGCYDTENACKTSNNLPIY